MVFREASLRVTGILVLRCLLRLHTSINICSRLLVHATKACVGVKCSSTYS
jgi:hypothetical protein